MNTLIDTLYNILSFITEDAVAHKLFRPCDTELIHRCKKLMKYIEDNCVVD